MQKSDDVFGDDDDGQNSSTEEAISVANYLQLISNEKKTCTLKVFRDKAGYVTFSDGTIIASKCGAERSDEALRRILSFDYASYKFMEYIEPLQVERLNSSFMTILLNYAKDKDEGGSV